MWPIPTPSSSPPTLTRRPLFRRARLNGQAQRPGRRSRWSKTVYYGDAGAARTAAAAAPGATVEELKAPSTPSGNEGGEGNPSDGQTGTTNDGQPSGDAKRECRGQDRWQHRSRRPDRRQRDEGRGQG
ncbi:MAG: hypothetical protein ACLTDR_06400 [Adlercreutzia equolifaciens]